ncbi:hypothetical protein [Rhizobium halophytocola]|uniref:DUF4258 domain-containing protein n=1 Tax=Rhizobium halophytocola TaxID=735519 RepID=A0ABS4E429_9HYPH|nr:hypothetical protein [Rhizobium halophytocola]MBP1852706.1 hypothetical protein [Rhizobium halophytocola]
MSRKPIAIPMPVASSAWPDVTDHAVLRYLERRHGLDVASIREQIARACIDGVRYGATGVTHDGVKFVLQQERVVSCLPTNWHSRDLRTPKPEGDG